MPVVRRTLIGAAFLAAPSGCIEYDRLRHANDTDRGAETDAADTDTTPVEICDGIDNDADGAVDEGYADANADGVLDCVQCIAEARPAEYTFGRSVCTMELTPSVDPWNIVESWRVEPSGGCRLGAIIDLDGDGVSDVLCAGYYGALALSGRDGTVLWQSEDFDQFSPLTAADIDGDGALEIVGLAPRGEVVAIRTDGSLIWRGDEPRGYSAGTVLYIIGLRIADLWSDGAPTIVTPLGTMTADGVAISEFEPPDPLPGPQELAIADLDFDGEQEVLTQAIRFTRDGARTWTVTGAPEGERIQPVVLQADADVDGEVAWVFDNLVLMVDPDGTERWRRSIGELGKSVSLACAGDLDADGRMDLVLTDEKTLYAWDSAGTQIWSMPIDEGSYGYSGCTMFDFDGDRAKEVLFADQTSFYVLDGSTGVPRFRDVSTPHRSATAGDFPVVADLDGDGSVEIIVPSIYGSTGTGIVVYTNPAGDWPPGSQIWPSEDWSGTSLYLDGTVPRKPPPAWLRYGVWRGQPEFILDSVDLRPEVEYCAAESEADAAEVRLAVRLANLGTQYVVEGTPMAVYLLDDDGARHLHTVIGAPEFLDAGQATPTTEIVLDRAQARRGVVLVAADDGTTSGLVNDCDPDNDTLVWRLE